MTDIEAVIKATRTQLNHLPVLLFGLFAHVTDAQSLVSSIEV